MMSDQVISPAVHDISDWLIDQALGTADLGMVIDGLCRRLTDLGMDLVRGHVSVRTLHPVIGAVGMTWRPDQGVEIDEFPHEAQASEGWLRSPFKAMLDAGLSELRLDAGDPAIRARFPLVAGLAAEGVSEYVALLTRFGALERFPSFETRHLDDGVLTSWSSGRPGGFTAADLAALRRLMPRLSVVVRVAMRYQFARNALVTYLGRHAGPAVLSGQIRRGDGRTIPAVIWYSDLRNSTPLAERYAGTAFLAVLNDYFEATAGAVLDHGGEVLRFIGDAVLAIFPYATGAAASGDSRWSPLADLPPTPGAAGRAALAAAAAAHRRLADINVARTAAGEATLTFGLGLHVGDVIYGNIGVSARLEFTVIGPAANEGARIEGVCRDLGEPVVVSEAFADLVDQPMRPLGRHRLRGVGSEQALFAPIFDPVPAGAASGEA